MEEPLMETALQSAGGTSKQVLVITPIPTHPLDSGNHVRVACLAGGLKRLGHEVTVLHVPWCPGSVRPMRRHWGSSYLRTGYRWPRSLWLAIAASRVSQLFKADFLHRWTRRWWLRNRPLDLWYGERLDGVIRRLQSRQTFDIVIVEYVLWSRALTLFGPETVKVIDTHDVFTDRYQLLRESTHSVRFWPWGSVSLSREDEARGLDRADAVLAIQESEAERLRTITGRPVVTVGHLLPNLEKSDACVETSDVLFVGSAWTPNVDGARWFLREILPEVRRRLPSAKLVVAGRVCNQLAESAGCVKLGVVRDLHEAYRRAACVINPVQSGTGLAIKSIEALGFGRPLVTSPAGARGLEEAAGRGMTVARDPHEWVEQLCRLLTNRGQLVQESQAAWAFAEQWNRRQLEGLRMLLDRAPVCSRPLAPESPAG